MADFSTHCPTRVPATPGPPPRAAGWDRVPPGRGRGAIWSVLAALAVLAAVALVPVTGTRADTPVPEDAELDGLYPAERDIIREIDEIPILVPDMDEKLAERLSEADSFEKRRQVLDDLEEEFADQYEDNPFIDREGYEQVKARISWLFDVLRIAYWHENAWMGTNEVFGTLPADEQRRAGDLSSLTPAQKRVLGIPLTPEEKARSGLDDLTPAELEDREIPPRPGQAGLPPEEPEDRRTSQADPFMRPSFGLGTRYGEVDRGNVSYLRTQFGGVVIDSAFAGIEREHEFKAIDGEFTFPLGTYSLGDKPFDLRLFTAGTYAFGDLDMDGDLISAGGDQLAILGPEGPSGPLGGGLVTAAGFGDVTDWSYADDYDEILIRGGVEAQSAFADPPVRLRPRLSFLYSHTDEDSSFSGFTNAGTVFFDYDTELESDRYGAELGLYADVPVGGNFSLYLDGAARVTYDDAKGSTSLSGTTFGTPFASEQEHYSDSGWHLGGTLGGGVAVDWGQVRGSLGAEFETWQVPVPQVTGEEPASIDFESRDSWVLKAQVKLRF